MSKSLRTLTKNEGISESLVNLSFTKNKWFALKTNEEFPTLSRCNSVELDCNSLHCGELDCKSLLSGVEPWIGTVYSAVNWIATVYSAVSWIAIVYSAVSWIAEMCQPGTNWKISLWKLREIKLLHQEFWKPRHLSHQSSIKNLETFYSFKIM